MMEKTIPPTATRRGSAGQGLLRNVEMVELIRHQMEMERFAFSHPSQFFGGLNNSDLDLPILAGQQPPGFFNEVTLPIYEETVRTTNAAAEAAAAAAAELSSSEGSDLVEVLDDSDTDDIGIVFANQLVLNSTRNQAQAGGSKDAGAEAKESDKAKGATEADKKTGEEEEEEELPPTFRWVHIEIK